MQSNSSKFINSQELLAESIAEDIRFWHEDIKLQNPGNPDILEACKIIDSAMIDAFDILTRNNPSLRAKMNKVIGSQVASVPHQSMEVPANLLHDMCRLTGVAPLKSSIIIDRSHNFYRIFLKKANGKTSRIGTFSND